MPSYAYDSFLPLGKTTAKHIGGISGWGYWLGWFPVAPINMLLAAGYIAVLFHVPLGRSFLPLGSLGTPVSMGVLVITVVGLVALFVPCYLGIRLGATFATILGVLAMVPLTLLVLLPIFKPSSFHWSNISGFHYADPKTAGTIFFLSWIFVISWNAIAMEAAACYIGECRDPARDAKIALTAEGLYGVFIYIATAVVFVGVLGASLKSADPLTLYTSFADHIFGSAGWVKYVIGIPLIFALLLSVLNAIMGVARSLFQASEDRLLPKFFEHQNKHKVPDRAMIFNVVCSILVGLFGSPVRIYVFSNVGYIIAVAASLFGYFLMRQLQPERKSPFRMPGFFRWVALACGLFLTFDYFVGGWNSPNIVVGPGTGHFLYIMGLIIVAMYFPLYYWRQMMDRRAGIAPSDEMPLVIGSPGGIDLGGMAQPHLAAGDEVGALPHVSAAQAETEL
jgi:amino acid transporter